MKNIAIDGKWKQMRGQAKESSGQSPGDQHAQLAGKFDKLVGVFQEKYGYNRERAERELRRRMTKRRAHEAVR